MPHSFEKSTPQTVVAMIVELGCRSIRSSGSSSSISGSSGSISSCSGGSCCNSRRRGVQPQLLQSGLNVSSMGRAAITGSGGGTTAASMVPDGGCAQHGMSVQAATASPGAPFIGRYCLCENRSPHKTESVCGRRPHGTHRCRHHFMIKCSAPGECTGHAAAGCDGKALISCEARGRGPVVLPKLGAHTRGNGAEAVQL